MPGFLGGSTLAVPSRATRSRRRIAWIADFTSTASEKALEKKGNIPNATNLLGNSVNERAAARELVRPAGEALGRRRERQHPQDDARPDPHGPSDGQAGRADGRARTSRKPSTSRRPLLSGSEPTALTAAAATARAVAAAAADRAPRRRRRRSRTSCSSRSSPSSAAILGYPIYYLVRLSLQRYDLFALSAAPRRRTSGCDNFRTVLHDPVFWHTLLRTVVFTAANVGLTIVLGTLVALLLVRVSTWVRLLLTAGLVLVWAMPPVVAVQVWSWMTNSENGVLNYVLTELHVGNYFQHNWYETPFWQLDDGDDADRLGGAAVRRDHRLRGALAGAARARRGGADRRRARLAGLQGRDDAGARSRSCSSSPACRSSGTSASSPSRTC